MTRHFYATADDLLPVFNRIDSKHTLAYTLTGLFESLPLTTVRKGVAIPTLRIPVVTPNAINCPSYLVTPSDVTIHVREVQQNNGTMRYAVDQLMNPESVLFSHGGFFTPEVLLYGRVGTASDSPIAKTLFRAYSSAIAKAFVRIKRLWVGPQAAELMRKGCRLTIGADSPRECDLVP